MPTDAIEARIVGFSIESDHFKFATDDNRYHAVSNDDVQTHLGCLNEQDVSDLLPLNLVGRMNEKSSYIIVVNYS